MTADFKIEPNDIIETIVKIQSGVLSSYVVVQDEDIATLLMVLGQSCMGLQMEIQSQKEPAKIAALTDVIKRFEKLNHKIQIQAVKNRELKATKAIA